MDRVSGASHGPCRASSAWKSGRGRSNRAGKQPQGARAPVRGRRGFRRAARGPSVPGRDRRGRVLLPRRCAAAARHSWSRRQSAAPPAPACGGCGRRSQARPRPYRRGYSSADCSGCSISASIALAKRARQLASSACLMSAIRRRRSGEAAPSARSFSSACTRCTVLPAFGVRRSRAVRPLRLRPPAGRGRT